MKRLISLSLALVMLLCLFLMTPAVQAAETTTGGYYYEQLIDENSKAFYNLLVKMRDEGLLQSGTYTADLVAEQVLENTFYEQKALMATFAAGRDAFMFDNAALFYVDFEKLSITATQTGSQYSYTLGVGRDTNYFRTGFDRSNVKQAVSDFAAKVSAIATAALEKADLEAQIRAAYEGVMDSTSYALEAQAKPENVNYVRTPYGALVKGQSVCEGYARALKAVLDEMDIENILVQGYYSESTANGPQEGPHMWNYVRMDDNRWYLLDATMDDGNAQEHFLLPGTSSLLLPYQPEGMLSPSDVATEFSYPTLSPIVYQPMTQAFTVTGDDWQAQFSYNGKGILANRADGNYLLASYDGASWYYVENHVKWIFRGYQDGPDYHPETVDLLSEIGGIVVDTAEYFLNYPSQYAYLAVTNVPRPTVFDAANEKAYFAFDINSNSHSFFDLTKVGESIDLKKSPPYITQRTPNSTSLKDGEEINVTVTYSEDLVTLSYLSTPDILLHTTESDADVSNFKWDKNNPREVSFTIKAGSGFGHSVNYFLYLSGLVGAESKQMPNAIAFSKLHLPDFSCPKVLSDINNIHSTTPALIADKDLSLDDWLGTDGQPIGENLPFELALVASELPESSEDASELTNEKMENLAQEASGAEVLASKTYDISLSLCSGQVSYIQGRRVKVFVPFPGNYNASSNVAYKAYHYNETTGEMEEIDCVVVAGGIIMMCESFSPFTVVALPAETVTQRTVITHADGNGSFTKEMVKLSAGETAQLTVTAASGYRIESLKLNGEALPTAKLRMVNQQLDIPLSYDQLKDSGNTLEATFVLEEISTERPSEQASVTVSNTSGAAVTAPENGWTLGENTFTVSAEQNVVVAVTNDNGATYTRLAPAGSETANTYTANITGDSAKISVILAGDADNNGLLDSNDAAAVKAACLKSSTPNALGQLVYDLNGDGKINILDLVLLRAALK